MDYSNELEALAQEIERATSCTRRAAVREAWLAIAARREHEAALRRHACGQTIYAIVEIGGVVEKARAA